MLTGEVVEEKKSRLNRAMLNCLIFNVKERKTRKITRHDGGTLSYSNFLQIQPSDYP
jgi:hypothetical protein